MLIPIKELLRLNKYEAYLLSIDRDSGASRTPINVCPELSSVECSDETVVFQIARLGDTGGNMVKEDRLEKIDIVALK